MSDNHQTQPPPLSGSVVQDPAVDHKSPFWSPTKSSPVLILVEGIHDVQFLRRISRILCSQNEPVPDLENLERSGRLLFVPCGGGGILAWTHRFEPLRLRELHLYDRETPPETEIRRIAVRRVNSRSGCHAWLLKKRSIENYLHPVAIRAAGGPDVEFGDHESVAKLLASESLARKYGYPVWNDLSRRTQKRVTNRAKRWLNTSAVQSMTPELLRCRDPDGELLSWLAIVAQLIRCSG